MSAVRRRHGFPGLGGALGLSGLNRPSRGAVLGRSQAALTAALLRVRPQAELAARGYVVNLEDNLLHGLTRDDLEEEFGSAAGQELDAKMRAPWSSAALAVNAFWPWKRDPSRLSLAGLTGFSPGVGLEAQCPNGVSTIPPHLDALLEHGDTVVGVESKCTEHLRGKRQRVKQGYLDLAAACDTRTQSRCYAVLDHVPSFYRLDAYQLVKHFLGLSLTYPGRPLILVYLFWEPQNAAEFDVFASHRAEVEHFAALVHGDESFSFASLSYTEHWADLEENGPAESSWLPELRRRYDVSI